MLGLYKNHTRHQIIQNNTLNMYEVTLKVKKKIRPKIYQQSNVSD